MDNVLNRRNAMVAGAMGLAAALIGGNAVAAITNPTLGNVTNADVVRLRNARDILDQVIPVWDQDGRYSSQVPELIQTRDSLNRMAQMISDYLAVQGT